MSDIDWRAVETVVNELIPQILDRPEEKIAAIRRLEHRMLTSADWYWARSTASKLTCEQVAELILTTKGSDRPRPISARSVERIAFDLPRANRCVCPDCFEDMWVVVETGVVEPHADRFGEECRASRCKGRTGLAAIRPDLFAWIRPPWEVGA